MRLIFFFFSHQPQSPVCLTRVCIIRLFSLMNLQKCIFHSDHFIFFFLILFYLFFREDNTDDRRGGAILFSFNFFLFPPATIASLPNTGMHHSTFLFVDECTKVYLSFSSFYFLFSYFILFIFLREDNTNDRL